MLTTLLAIRVIAGVAPTPLRVKTPSHRIITFSKLGSSFAPQQQLDPTDAMDFLLDLTPLLGEGEEFASVDIRVVAVSQLLGFLVMDDLPFRPEVVSNGRVRIWATVKPENHNALNAEGHALPHWGHRDHELAAHLAAHRTSDGGEQVILGIDNGWRGPIEGLATMSALAAAGEDGTRAVLALERRSALTTPRVGQRFTADGTTWEVASRAESPRHLLSFNCIKIELGV